MPDDELEIPDGEGEPISQDELDALLSNTENPGADGSDALGAYGGFDSGDAEAAMTDEEVAALAQEYSAAGGGITDSGFGGTPAGSAIGSGPSIGLEAFDMNSFSIPSPSDTVDPGFQRVRDIPLEVTVELGRTRMLIKDILDLSTGAIVELDKIAGEPVDLFANGLLVARGEVIVIDDNFGVRVTEIITAEDRLKAEHEHSMAA